MYEQGRLNPRYGWEINPTRPTSDTMKHASPSWAQHEGMIVLCGQYRRFSRNYLTIQAQQIS